MIDLADAALAAMTAARSSQRFLVTTSRSLLLFDAKSRRIDRIHSGSGLYYGVDVGVDQILVAARNRMVSSDTPADAESGEILVFDRELNLTQSLRAHFPLRDLHQIRSAFGKLYACCAFDNAIAVRHADGRWSQWLPLGKSQSAPWDVNHFNTVEKIDDMLCVLAHNRGASEILVFDPHTHLLCERVAIGLQAHNIWRAAEEWRVCSSAAGCLLGTAGFKVETGGFPRGIYVGKDYAIVGISELAERKARDFTDAKLVIYDAAWQECDRIDLTGEGLVLDIAELRANEMEVR